jgi:hypothetical protein
MGRFLLILLVLLVPLRGWSAERMAVQMAHQSQMGVEVGIEQVSMPADCSMMAQPSSQTEGSSIPSKSHAGCQTCQLCMSVTNQNFSGPNILAFELQAPRVPDKASFISADLLRHTKPPIL